MINLIMLLNNVKGKYDVQYPQFVKFKLNQLHTLKDVIFNCFKEFQFKSDYKQT